MKCLLYAVVTTTILMFWASNGAAVPCAGFVDIDTSSAFCANVAYLKSRGVTVGCTDSNHYCPTDVVTRLQMAAFLNRLGNATAGVTWVDATGRVVGTGVYSGAFDFSAGIIWRTPYGITSLGPITVDPATGLGTWPTVRHPTSDSGVYYPTNDCSGQAYARADHGYPVQTVWELNRIHLLKLHTEDVAAPVPGVYSGGKTYVTTWSFDGYSAAICQVWQVDQSTLFVRADDVRDITDEFVQPFHLE